MSNLQTALMMHLCLVFTDSPVTHSEILAAIASLQSKKSTDFTGLSTFFIKQFSYEIAKPLQHIINLSLSNSIVPPSQMKIAKIVPIHKSGPRTSMDNYRPISLLSCFSKILEKVVCSRLCSFLEINNILSGSQFGFRSGHSTIHPMVHFVNHVSTALNNKEHIIEIFCDLRKAFDSCDHKILLKKLYAVGIRGAALDWFQNYLTGRKQFVIINGQNSSLKEVLLGVPQGSILGPLQTTVHCLLPAHPCRNSLSMLTWNLRMCAPTSVRTNWPSTHKKRNSCYFPTVGTQ
jgi:hypothetical protein